jgi:serine/threonine protein kinase
MDGAAINNRYRVIRDLARGGMGRVCLVEDTRLEDRRMALKTLLPHVTSP